MSALSAVRSAWATDTGRQRAVNEDRIWADDAQGLYIVADGLGGHAAGELAAETAIAVVVRELARADWSDPPRDLRQAVTAANNEIYSLAQRDPANTGMACVLTLLSIRDHVATTAHVGDSRLYLFWNGTLRKVTSDHSPVGEQEDQGELTETEAMNHPRRNEVYRDVGSRERDPDDPGFIEVRSFSFHPSAALLLCTDGLSDVVTSSEIVAILETYDGDAAAIVHRLIEAANDNAGPDNVSVAFVPGPEFVGARSALTVEGRSRHVITRVRQARAQWKRRLGRIALVLLGIVLGMVTLAFVQRFFASGGPPK